MKYYLDTEINESGGEIISLALVREDNESIYLINSDLAAYDYNRNIVSIDRVYSKWIQENVINNLFKVPNPLSGMLYNISINEFPYKLSKFFAGDNNINIITDWPDNINYMCEYLITEPGKMVNIPSIQFILRVDAYPTDLENAVQHNAWWDAKALKHLLEKNTNSQK